ncbi:MAG: hypothetical protein HFJ57_06065 [Clostridia bacterium]|nr:hypothetical protein [Clostridia bacterium]
MERKRLKDMHIEKGITLIILVITITLLLILAGIIVQWAIGENRYNFKSKRSKTENTRE